MTVYDPCSASIPMGLVFETQDIYFNKGLNACFDLLRKTCKGWKGYDMCDKEWDNEICDINHCPYIKGLIKKTTAERRGRDETKCIKVKKILEANK